MILKEQSPRGRFSVTVELANNDDMISAQRGYIPEHQVRRATITGVVDSGASRLVLPEVTVRQLGLQMTGTVGVRYAAQRTGQRALAGGCHLTFAGRSSVFNAVVEPERETALIGAIVMEDLDLIIECTRGALVPRDPERIISEIE